MGAKKWLEPSTESDTQKAERRRLAKERNMTPAELEAALTAEQRKAKLPKPKITKASEPKPLWPDVQPMADLPDPRLVEIARMWPKLSEREREELVMLMRVMVHLDRKAPGK